MKTDESPLRKKKKRAQESTLMPAHVRTRQHKKMYELACSIQQEHDVVYKEMNTILADMTCCFCMQQSLTPENATVLNCGHAMHSECLAAGQARWTKALDMDYFIRMGIVQAPPGYSGLPSRTSAGLDCAICREPVTHNVSCAGPRLDSELSFNCLAIEMDNLSSRTRLYEDMQGLLNHTRVPTQNPQGIRCAMC